MTETLVKLDDLRFVHCDGATMASYANEGNFIVTGGADGEIHVYPGLYDDEVANVKCSNEVTVLAVKGKRVFAANASNEVKAYSLPDISLEAMLMRFSARVNHVCSSSDGKSVAACASDFTIKVVDANGGNQKAFSGHNAPILSVCFSPDASLLASSSCDGSVRIWKVAEQKLVKQLDILPKCNDIRNYAGLCRLDWSKKLLVVPVGKQFKIFHTESWGDETYPEEHTQGVSVVCWAGSLLVSASVNGEIFFWDAHSKKCVKKYQHHASKKITSLDFCAERPSDLLFADDEGQIGLCAIPQVEAVDTVEDFSEPNEIDMMDSDDDEILLGTSRAKRKRSQATGHGTEMCPRKNDVGDDDIDNDDVDQGAAKKKSRVNNMDNFLADEAEEDDDDSDPNISLNLIKEGLLPKEPFHRKPIIKEDEESLSDFIVEDKIKSDKSKTRGSVECFVHEPFQPSATPAHLMHRFMVWNSLGIMRCHSEDDISSIDVEFHDATTHHALQIPNTLGHRLAALSATAVVLACDAQGDIPSKLTCHHFATWDANKEWTISMPSKENITVLAVNNTHVAIATDRRLVRIFSVGGAQLQLWCIPGPAVSMAMHERQLLVVFHHAAGVRKAQCLGAHLYECKKGFWKLVCDLVSPLHDDAALVWVGFSAEGSPVLVDTTGDVRILQRSARCLWVPVANVRSSLKSKSDNYWVVGVEESTQKIRCILCKGSAFPTTLPRPVPTTLPFQMPVCEVHTDKGKIEHDLILNRLMACNARYSKSACPSALDLNLDDYDRQQTQLLMKLFALACKSERDYRAVEICRLMPTAQTIGLAIHYASTSKRMNLARKLDELARQRAQEEEEEADEGDVVEDGCDDDRELPQDDQAADDDDEEELCSADANSRRESERCVRSGKGPTSPIRLSISGRPRANPQSRGNVDDQDPNDHLSDSDKLGEFSAGVDFDVELNTEPSSSAISSCTGETARSFDKGTPLAGSQNRNPFKVRTSNESAAGGRGTEYFEKLTSNKVSKAKHGCRSDLENKASSKPPPLKIKKAAVIPFSKQSAEAKNLSRSLKTAPSNNEAPQADGKKIVTGFQLFLDSQLPEPVQDCSSETIESATLSWKSLSREEKASWNLKASEAGPRGDDVVPDDDSKNRKVLQERNEKVTAAQPKLEASHSKSKLASFAFKKT